MKHYIFKLKFTSPVRFGGDNFSYALTGNIMAPHSDTLFSAISNEWIKIYGEEDYKHFIHYAEGDEFLLSDLLPYKNTDKDSFLYIPKPIIFIEKEKKEEQEEGSNLKKQLKNLEYIKINDLDKYIKFLHNGGMLPIEGEVFGHNHLTARVNKDRSQEPIPYNVMSFVFNENAGIYFIVGITNKYLKKFKSIIQSLGETGIGGKKTSGFGKFHLREDAYEIGIDKGKAIGKYDSDLALAKKLFQAQGSFLSLSMIYPKKDDLYSITDKDTYMLLNRRGFVYSEDYAKQLVKRKPSYAFNRGSVFNEKLKGQILDLSIEGTHPVYRYGKGFFIGGMNGE